MSDLVLGSLITAAGAIVVALIALYQHRSGERDKAEAAETEKRLSHAELLFAEHRRLNVELRTELDRERADKERIRSERDDWRRRAVTAERRVDEWLQDKG